MQVDKARIKLNELTAGERRVNGERLIFSNGNVGFSESELYQRTPQFETKLCNHLGIPYGFYEECSPVLKGQILNEFLKEKSGFSLILRNDMADTLLSGEDVFIPTGRVFDTLIKALEISDVEVEKTGSHITMDLVSNRITTEPRKGDITQAGIHVQTGQYDGLSYRIGIEAYALRLVCTNGLIRKESENKMFLKKIGSEEMVLKFLEEAGRYLMNQNRIKYLPEYAETVNHTTTDPAQVLHAIAVENRLSGKLERELIGKAPSLGDNPTYYDVINLVTQYGNTSKHRRRLQYIGGNVVRTLVERCPHCHHTLK